LNGFLLELLNGNWGIACASLTIICIMYLVHETIARDMPSWQWREKFTVGMAMASGLGIAAFGIAFRSAEVYFWRVLTSGDLEELKQPRLLFGGTVALVGFLMLIRTISLRLYGNRPWVWTLIAMSAFTAGSLAARLL
jgi:F0F1-type ATP synthase membrane subunit a